MTLQHLQTMRPLFAILFLAAWFAACGPAPAEEPRITRIPATPTAAASPVLRALITAVPADLTLSLIVEELATLTPIPTVTPDETAAPSSTPAPAPTQTPSQTPTATTTPLPPTATPTPPIPLLPEILPTPVITRSIRVPILMYHYISVPPEDADRYRINLSVPPDRFHQQMAYLAANSYHVIDLYDVIDALVRNTPLPERPVVLTFDDGYADNYENAYPILEEFGFKGTFFVLPELIDNRHPAYMSWEMIHEMAARGHRFESHTKNHPDLTTLGRAELIWQILGSQETLAAHLGYKPRFFAYPSGRYNEKTLNILQELNFWGAVTTQGGVWRGLHDRLEWTRTRVSFQHEIGDLEKALIPRNDFPTPTPSPTPSS